jgi:acetyl esterase/lipase
MPNLKRLKAVGTVVASLRGGIPYATMRPTETLAYAGPANGYKRVADVYQPTTPNGTSVVLIHGGGFVIGSRDMKPMRVLATDLVNAGVTVCSVDYRLLPRARVPGMRDDAVLALFWWLDEVRRRGLNADAVDLVGLSAGGTLACLANEAVPAGSIRQLILGFPLLDVTALSGRGVGVLARVLFPKGDRARWSPVVVCTAQTPVTIHQGTADLLVKAEVVDRVVGALRDRGVSVQLHSYEGGTHGLFNAPTDAHAVVARQRVVAQVSSGPQ